MASARAGQEEEDSSDDEEASTTVTKISAPPLSTAAGCATGVLAASNIGRAGGVALKVLLESHERRRELVSCFRGIALAERARAEAAERELRARLAAGDDEPKESCSICLAPLLLSESRAQLVSCRHTFHLTCIRNAVKEDVLRENVASCPMCRLGDAADFTKLTKGEALLPLSGAPPPLPTEQILFCLPIARERTRLPLQSDLTDTSTRNLLHSLRACRSAQR